MSYMYAFSRSSKDWQVFFYLLLTTCYPSPYPLSTIGRVRMLELLVQNGVQFSELESKKIFGEELDSQLDSWFIYLGVELEPELF